MEEILNTYQNITEVIKNNIITTLLSEAQNINLDQNQLNKINYIVESTIQAGTVNGYEALQAVITSKITNTPKRKSK